MLTESDELNLEVTLFSSQQKTSIDGILINHAIPKAQLTFGNDKSIEIVDLGAISTALQNGKSLTIAGDSGAWIRTKHDNKVIGMVIGEDKDKKATYFIKMKSILDHDPIMKYKIFE